MSLRDRLCNVVIGRPVLTLLIMSAFVALAAVGGSGVEQRLTNVNPVDVRSESSQADRILRRDFRGGAANYVVIVTPPTTLDAATTRAAAGALIAEARRSPAARALESYWTSGSSDEMRSRDGRSGLITIRLAGDNQAAAEAAAKLTAALRSKAGDLQLGFAGEAEVEAEAAARSAADLQRAELIAAPLTLVLLVLVFGSVIAAALPLLVGVASILTTMLVLRLISSFTDVSIFALNTTTALGLGLAIDYSLFVLARFREETAAGRDTRAALVTTMRTAGRTVTFSALTVALAFSALLVFPMDFLRSFGYAGIAVVLLSAAGALTILPATLALLGLRVNNLDVLAALRRRRLERGVGFWYRLARAVMRAPLRFALPVIALLLLLGSPFPRAEFGLTDDRVLPRAAQAHQASEELRTRFELGAEVPVVLAGIGAGRVAEVLPDYAARLSRVAGVVRVETATGSYADGQLIAPSGESGVQRYASRSSSWLNVATRVTPMSAAGGRLVADLRSVSAPGRALVAGQSAQLVDARRSIASTLPVAAIVIVLAMLLLLFLFTGSVLLPVKAVVLAALSLSATFGAMVFLFQDGHLNSLIGSPIVTGTIDMSTPILMFVMGFGLSMDYELFLLSRIREEYQANGHNEEAVATGLHRTGRLVTSAAVLLAVLLLAFATSGITPVKMLGIGMALAVIMDATLVRGILVPAFMRLAGSANWWAPRSMRRLHERFGLSETPHLGPVETTSDYDNAGRPVDATGLAPAGDGSRPC